MKRRYTLCLNGENAAETAHVLVRRLIESGCQVSPPGCLPGDDFEGVAIVLGIPPGKLASDNTVELSPHDTPDFAAEKILDSLGECGVISLEPEGYTEEEEVIRQRLADLGYIE